MAAEAYSPHYYTDELPDIAVACADTWARAVAAGEPGAVALAESLGIEIQEYRGVTPLSAMGVASDVFAGLLNERPSCGWGPVLDAVFGAESSAWVWAIFEAWEEDHAVGEQPPAGLEGRIRERVASRVHNAADLRWLAQNGPRILTLVRSQD